MPISQRDGKWYWGKQGPFDSRKKAEKVAQAAYSSGYTKKVRMHLLLEVLKDGKLIQPH